MPKAILAMRSYPATIILAILLFLTTLLITAASLGKVRNGGDGGDGGSGMGGTGKSGEFGGSGFGGTGGPSPFFTMNEEEDSHKPEAQVLDVAIPGLESAAVIIVQEPASASPDSVPNPVQQSIAEHPLVEQTRQEIAQGAPSEKVLVTKEVPEQIVQEERQTAQKMPKEDSMQIASLPEAVPAPEVIIDASQAQEELLRKSPQLAETITVVLDTEVQDEEQEPQRNTRPERIQRPELPPFQRIRPVERPAMLPPRVQPMRI